MSQPILPPTTNQPWKLTLPNGSVWTIDPVSAAWRMASFPTSAAIGYALFGWRGAVFSLAIKVTSL